jgi:sulfate adenylyltransferase subunit 2
MNNYNINHLELESESVYVIREVAAQDKPTMLFSGGKDSIVMYHWPGRLFNPMVPSDAYRYRHNFRNTRFSII